MSYWANCIILNTKSGNKVKKYGKELKSKDEKSAIEEAKTLVIKLNDQERKRKSDLRYGLYHVVKIIKKMALKDKSFWLDEQTFKDLYPKEKYPKEK